uniref:Choline transporter-like protein n=1 Tax=Aegilops tauschii subsp. strangulata TaxID=200361 RepID=A0A453AV31_AEGTS
GQQPDGARGRAPAPEQREVKVVVMDEPPPAVSRLQAQRPVAPLQVTTQAPPPPMSVASGGEDPPPPAAAYPPLMQQTPPQPLASLNSRVYTNQITLCLFLLQLAAAGLAVGFFVYRAVKDIVQDPRSRNARREQSLLRQWLPPVEGAVALSIVLAFAWQKAVRAWPRAMVTVILWSAFGVTLAVGSLLMCFSMPATVGLGVALVVFSIGTGLYACWVTRRVGFTARVFEKAVQPVDKFRGLNGPAYLMVAAGFVWISVWCVAVIGAVNFRFPGLTILALVVSLAWTAEVMRNVANLTASRVIALYYLRGMQSSVQFSFQRALSYNLGSACLGSLFVPTIEALRILARGLNLLEGEDEFMFSCAHCCLNVMNAVFEFGNSWAFVHVSEAFLLLSPCISSVLTSLVCLTNGDSFMLVCRADCGVRQGVRAGVAEHVEPVRGAAGDAGAGGRGHHELGVLPDRGDQRRAVRGAGGLVDVRDAQALHGHSIAHGVLRGVPDDPDRHGAAAGVRGLLLRVLRREPQVPALRGQPHRGAAEQDEGGRAGRRRGRAHPAVPAPARQRRLTPAAAAVYTVQARTCWPKNRIVRCHSIAAGAGRVDRRRRTCIGVA